MLTKQNIGRNKRRNEEMTNKEDIRALTDTGGCEGGVEGPPCSDRPRLLTPDAALCDASADEQPSLYIYCV
jgi:hypothetical protein